MYRDEIRKTLGDDLFLIAEREYSYNHLLSKYDSLVIFLEPFIEEKDTGRIEHYEIGINDLYISEEKNRIVVELIEIDPVHVHRFLGQIADMPEIQLKRPIYPCCIDNPSYLYEVPLRIPRQPRSGISLG